MVSGLNRIQVPEAPAQGKLWALLVAGSNTWGNYRHQSDVYHAYQIIHAHGIPDENIIVMHFDDLAENKQNPTKGIVINHPNGEDVYKGVPKDYIGKDVTAKNFISILTGDKEAMAHIGSGKVIESGPNDHVFVNYVDHGNTGILGFPTGPTLTVKQLNDALLKMNKENRYGELTLYVEACESGSMFRNVLPDNINIFATTASDYDESSYACYYDADRHTYLGDWYSVNWMEDSDAEDIESESLQHQFVVTKNLTHTSHVMEYGDLKMGDLIVGEFQGLKAVPAKTVPSVPFDGVPSFEVPLAILYRRQADATSQRERQQIQAEISQMIERRGHVDTIVNKLVARVALSQEQQKRLISSRPKQLTNLECHDTLVHSFHNQCFDLSQNTYAMTYAYVLANICEDGTLNTNSVVSAMQDVCKNVAVTGRID
jgi:legumain